jgi:hypothetical protein
MPTTDKGIQTVTNADGMLGPAQITKVAEDVDDLLDGSVPDSAALARITGAGRWLGRQLTVAAKKIRYEWDGSAWAPVSWPGLIRHWRGQYTANAAPGNQVMASRTVPVRPHAQRVHVIATGVGGFGASAGYLTVGLAWSGDTVKVTSNGKTYDGTPTKKVDVGPENGSAFQGGQFVSVSRAFAVEIPAGIACTLDLVSDASIEAFYRLSFEARTYGEGEFA